jgi:hypothetical protein
MKNLSLLLIITLFISVVSCKKTELEDVEPQAKDEILEKPKDENPNNDTSDDINILFNGSYDCTIAAGANNTSCIMEVTSRNDSVFISITGSGINPSIELTGYEDNGRVLIYPCDDFCFQGDYNIREGGVLEENINDNKKRLTFNAYDNNGSDLNYSVEEN